MLPPDPDTQDTQKATDAASAIVEILDVMCEHARGSVTTAPVSASQLRLMYLVTDDEGIRMRTLGQLLNTTPPSVSRLCDRLQAIGYLERRPCPHSGREVSVRLTSTGTAYLRQIRLQRDRALRHAIDALPLPDRRALDRGLSALHSQLTHTGEQAPGHFAADGERDLVVRDNGDNGILRA